MKRAPLTALLTVAGLVSLAAPFVPALPVQLLWFLPAVLVALTGVAGAGAGLIGAAASSAALGLAADRAPNFNALPAAAIGALWLLVILTDWQRRRVDERRRGEARAVEARREQDRLIQKDVDFYTERARALSERAGVRRQLATAARELGGRLDAADIHQRLVDLAGRLFPGAEVALTAGASSSPVAARAFERGQSGVTATDAGGRSEMAVPLRSGRSVVAALHVRSTGAVPRSYTGDDLRLLEVLSSLASEALENGALFEQIQQNAQRDGLTGLLTHRAFHERLEGAILEAARYRQPVSVILADVDHFKRVNDTHGHPAGDAILQGLAHVLDRNARDVDVVARYGGEEFVLLLFQCGYDEAMALAERVRQDIAAQVFDAGGKALYASASFGVATFPDDATSAQQLMRQADQRLYAAKKSGRNRVAGRFG